MSGAAVRKVFLFEPVMHEKRKHHVHNVCNELCPHYAVHSEKGLEQEKQGYIEYRPSHDAEEKRFAAIAVTAFDIGLFSNNSLFLVSLMGILLSNQYSVAMIYLVLNYLCRPAGVSLYPHAHVTRLPFDFYLSVPLGFSRSVERKAAFLGVVRFGKTQYLGVEHFCVFSVVVEHDDAHIHADHIRRHTDAFVGVGFQRVGKVVGGRRVFWRRGFRRHGKPYWVANYFFYHIILPLLLGKSVFRGFRQLGVTAVIREKFAC